MPDEGREIIPGTGSVKAAMVTNEAMSPDSPQERAKGVVTSISFTSRRLILTITVRQFCSYTAGYSFLTVKGYNEFHADRLDAKTAHDSCNAVVDKHLSANAYQLIDPDLNPKTLLDSFCSKDPVTCCVD